MKGYDGNIDFVNYDDEHYGNVAKPVVLGKFVYTFSVKDKRLLSYKIMIYKSVYDLGDEKIVCDINHELAHFRGVKFYFNTTESYANKEGCGSDAS